MPRQRQRIVYCDCFDCRDRPEGLSLTPEQLDAATAVARQEPPPKALLLYATGFMCAADGATNLDSCTLPHCNLVVREGNLGLLSVRQAEEAAGLEPAVAELAQLLGVYQDTIRQPPSGSGSEAQPGLPTLAARFKGMQAALGSTSAAARQLARQVGMAVVDRLCIGAERAGTGVADAGADGPGAGSAATATTATTAATAEPATTAATAVAAPTAGSTGVGGSAGDSGSGGASAAEQRSLAGVLPDANTFAGVMAAELGAAEGASGRDLLLLHLDLDDLRAAGAAGPASGERGAEASEVDAEADAEARWDAGCEALEWLDSLVRGLLALPEIRERTLLVLMLSPAGRKMPAVPGQGAAVGGGLLQAGGAKIDPAAAVVTPRNAALVGRGGAATAAAAVAAAAAVGMAGAGGALSVLDSEELPLLTRPVQSFEMLGMGRVELDMSTPVLVARRLPGVVRRDRAERLGYREALSAGGQGAILVDRLLHEVAYKIGRAPKYGA